MGFVEKQRLTSLGILQGLFTHKAPFGHLRAACPPPIKGTLPLTLTLNSKELGWLKTQGV